jgi:hypothetical protein
LSNVGDYIPLRRGNTQSPFPAGGGGGGVTSFNTRTGAVTPQTGDYTPTEVGFSSYPLTPGVDYPTPASGGGKPVYDFYITNVAGTMTAVDKTGATIGSAGTDVAPILQAIDAAQTIDTIARVFLNGFMPGGSGGTSFKPSSRKGMILCGFSGQDQEAPTSGINWSSATVSLWDDANWASFKHAEHLGLENVIIRANSFTGVLFNDSATNINSYVWKDFTITNVGGGVAGFAQTGTCFNPAQTTESNATSVLVRGNIFGFHSPIVSNGGLIGGDHLQIGFFNGHGIEFNGAFSNASVWNDIKFYNVVTPGIGIYDNRPTTPQSLLIINGIEQENSAFVNYQNVNGARYHITVSSPYIGIPSLPAILTNIGKGATYNKTETAADANLLTYTPPSDGSGGGISIILYKIRFALSVSAATAAVLGWTVTYTDINGNAQTPTNLSLFQQGTALPALTFTAAGAGEYYGEADIACDGITNIVVQFTLASGTIAAKATAVIEAA